MSPATALGLLGPLASLSIQRKHIIGGTFQTFMDPTEAINDGYAFLDHPLLGNAADLKSVKTFALELQRVASELDLSQPEPSNVELVERHEGWNSLRRAARAVLEELGANLNEWELGESET